LYRFKSTMIRNYVADTMLAQGMTLNKTSRLMNHKSIKATKHYLNKYHPGPLFIGGENDNAEEETSIINV
jgi:hypothetical protein